MHWDYKDGVYGTAADVLVSDIVRAGFRHVRGFDPRLSPILAKQGVTTTLPADTEVGDPAKIVAIVRQVNADRTVIDAVEGPNEPDLFWPMHHDTYKGQGFPAGVLAYQRDLFAAFAGIPGRAGLMLIGPSLGHTYDPGGGMPNPFPPGALAGSVDVGNVHPYPFGGNPFSPTFAYDGIDHYYRSGNFPSVNLDEFPYGLAVYAPPFAPKPMVATETGYPTWRSGVSEDVQARYLPRLFAEYFRLGIRRTYLYELVDDVADPSGSDMQAHFGILHHDLTPKPAFEALRSLTALLSVGAHTRVTGPQPVLVLAPRLPPGFDRPEFVHTLLLRVSDTHSLLLAWHEVSDADTSSTPPRTIMVPDGELNLTVAAPYRPDAWYGYGPDWHLRRHAIEGGTAQVCVPLQDRLVVVSLRRAKVHGP